MKMFLDNAHLIQEAVMEWWSSTVGLFIFGLGGEFANITEMTKRAYDIKHG
jgi:hypothetical protein